MKIRLTKPLPQLSLGRVIPAGVTIDAPAALYERLLREGRGEPAQPGKTPAQAVATSPKRQSTGKKVKRQNG